MRKREKEIDREREREKERERGRKSSIYGKLFALLGYTIYLMHDKKKKGFHAHIRT